MGIPDYTTVQEIALSAGVNDASVRRALLSGRLEGVKVGGRWLVARKEAERWIALPHRPGRLPQQFKMDLEADAER